MTTQFDEPPNINPHRDRHSGEFLFEPSITTATCGLIAGGHEHSQPHQSEPFPFLPFNRLAILGTAVLVGALTHLLWDSFTHQDGWWVQQSAVLSA
ncbi:MAG: DUF4184 family protein, partial [bacterium]